MFIFSFRHMAIYFYLGKINARIFKEMLFSNNYASTMYSSHSCCKLFPQISTTGNTTRITLIVQSLYNGTFENTSLYFDVCNNTADGGCERNRSTTTSDSINIEMLPEPVNEDQSIIIIIATLTGFIAVTLILVGVFCWKRKHNQKAEKRKGNWMARCDNTICHFFVGNVWKTQTRFHTKIIEFKAVACPIQ